MAALEDDIDNLYRLPLAEFTSARNALAKRAGARAGEIKSLEKPNLAAWAVNQLYWQRRRTYDQLIAAAERARQALKKQLTGTTADTGAAEKAHEQAVNAAAREARALLEAGGGTASAAVMTAIRDTLLALPGADRPGRLTAPMTPMGFEGLTSLLQGAALAPARKATVLPFDGDKSGRAAKDGASAESAPRRDHAAAAKDQEREKAAEQARRRQIAALEKELQSAADQSRAAGKEVTRAEHARAKAAATLEALRREADEAEVALQTATTDLNRARRAQKDADTTLAHLEARRSALGS